ncbi:MAG: ABC-F family ATP-binding cassette domain-containing protein [Alphaproteobacteria bacterium]
MAATLLLSVQDAAISFGNKHLFENLSFNIHEGNRICLVGKNGAGKTTLMNIITGVRDLDAGLRWQLQGTTIGYLQQEVTPQLGQTVYDFVFSGMAQDVDREINAYKIEQILEPLHLDIKQPMTELSGGQLRRAALAHALVLSPDILLLDEPTNHLDLDIIAWLETYLRGYRGALVCISHDRTFLANISDKVFWLDRGRLKVCPHGFSYFDEWAAMILEQEARELHNRQKVLDQEVTWASRGVQGRRKRNIRRLDLMKQERTKLRADKNALARMLARVEFKPTGDAPLAARSVVEFHNVRKFYSGVEEGRNKVILDGFNLRILRGDRIGIVGQNGSGKTSFLRLLVGEIAPDAGTVKRAPSVTFSYFDQKRKDLHPDYSLHRVLCPNGSDYLDVMGKTRHVCGYLKDFLFDPQQAAQPIATLSGGQKNRLLLAKVMANPGSLLILDEPTNDLDMDTLDMLEDMLAHYTGTLLVVSHDRDFLDQSVSKVLAFEGDGHVEGVIGGYQDYLADRTRRRAKIVVPEIAKPAVKPEVASAPKRATKRLTFTQQHELDKLPERMQRLEDEIIAIQSKLGDPNLYIHDPETFDRLSLRFTKITQDLAAAETRWLELEDLQARTD